MPVRTPQQTLENQPDAVLKFADQRPLRIDTWLTEAGSGTKAATERALGQLLPYLTAHDTVMVTELSHLGRRLMDILHVSHLLLDKQVALISLKEGRACGDTLNAEVLGFAFGLAVEIERHLMATHTRDALARCKREGKRLGQPPGRLSQQTKLTGRDEDIQRLLQKKVAVAAMARIMEVHRSLMTHSIKSRHLAVE
jgi:DNA invertase Pin-like site-specific DNA recombinase